MEEFKAARENRKPRAFKRAAVAIAALAGVTASAGVLQAMRATAKAGSILPLLLSREEAIRQADEYFESALNTTMLHNVRLSISNGSTGIEFMADGYDPGKKIAYEFVIGGYTNAKPVDVLTADELESIDGYRFGDTWILTIQADYYDVFLIRSEFERFTTAYTNR